LDAERLQHVVQKSNALVVPHELPGGAEGRRRAQRAKKEVKTLFSDLQVFTLPPAASPDFVQAMQKYRERLLVYGSNFK